jgi:hypothetical protein
MLLVGRIVELLCVYLFQVLVIVRHLLLLADLGSWSNCVIYESELRTISSLICALEIRLSRAYSTIQFMKLFEVQTRFLIIQHCVYIVYSYDGDVLSFAPCYFCYKITNLAKTQAPIFSSDYTSFRQCCSP